MTGITVYGLGNTDRGDDGAGVLVLRELGGRVPEAVQLHEIGTDPLRLLDLWPGVKRAILVDAVTSGAAPGTVHRIEDLQFTSERFTTSTHGMSIREVIQLARILDRMPAELIVVGIEAASVDVLSEISAGVLRGIGEAAEVVLAEIARE